MMRVKVVHLNENRNVVYFPDSLRFFQTNDKTAEIIKEIAEGKTYEYFHLKFANFSEKEFQTLKNYCSEMAVMEEISNSIKNLSRLVLNISNACNMKCKYCYAGGGAYGDKESFMSIDVLERTFAFFYKYYENIETIQLFGGEPTLNIEIIKYVCDYVKRNKKNTVVTMVTNGTNLTDEVIDIIEKEQIYVTVSIDCKELHDVLRPFSSGKGTYEIIKNNITQLSQLIFPNKA